MSLLTCSSRVAPSGVDGPLAYRIASTLRSIQPRRYASDEKKPSARPGRMGFRSANSKKRKQIELLDERKKDKYPGTFRPLPANQLTHQLFAPVAHKLDWPTLGDESCDLRAPGNVIAFPMNGKDAIELFGLPRNLLLEFRLLPKPCSLIRDVSLRALDMLDAAGQKSSLETRVVFTGDPGSGKSHLLLQVVEYCISKGWIVLYIPRAINLVNSTTVYTYDLRTQTYLQPVFAYQSLRRMLNCNGAALAGLHSQMDHPIDRSTFIPAGSPLTDLIAAGIKDQALAPVVLSTLFDELGRQEQRPVLLAVDDFQALYCRTAYRDAHFTAIRPFHLSMPRLVMEYASGRKSFARGAVLGAISTSHVDFQMPLDLREVLGLPMDRPTGPYAKRSCTLRDYMHGLRAFPVPDRLTVPEASSLFELWMKCGALHSSPNDELFLSKYSEASGNPKHFVWNGLLSTLTT